MSRSIIEHVKENDELHKLEDGYLCWFPTKGKGGLSAGNLREIADHLDAENKTHHEEIDAFLKKHSLEAIENVTA
jgi:hypothetical protein